MATACAVAVASCGGDSGTAPPPKQAVTAAQQVASVTFDRKVDSVEVERTSRILPTFHDLTGYVLSTPVDTSSISWTVADTTIASISSASVVSGHSVGTTTATISVNGTTASLPIVVLPPAVATLTFATTSITITEGDTLTIPPPQVTDRTGAVVTGRTPSYSAFSPSLSVSPTGLITALLAGSATVTASLDTVHVNLSVNVHPAAVAQVKLVPAVLDMGAGHTVATQASAFTVTGHQLRSRAYTYTIDNPSVASATSSGIVTGVAPGKATLTVASGTGSVNVPISVATLAAGAFTIDVRFAGDVPVVVQQAALQAAARWEQVISAPLIPYHVSVAANDCGTGVPAVDTIETNVLVIIRSDAIDGRSNTVGEGGPCIIRDNAPQLTALGSITVDSADISTLARQGILVDMLTHEMGHILGIGTFWQIPPFANTATGLGGVNPLFIGHATRVAAAELGFTPDSSLGVPIENTGGVGTRDGHWRADTFGHELMTGTLHAGLNPMSLVTIEALADFGYTVVPEAAADLSVLNANNPTGPVTPSLSKNPPVRGSATTPSPDVQIRETLLFPRFTVSRDGKLLPLPRPAGSAAHR